MVMRFYGMKIVCEFVRRHNCRYGVAFLVDKRQILAAGSLFAESPIITGEYEYLQNFWYSRGEAKRSFFGPSLVFSNLSK